MIVIIYGIYINRKRVPGDTGTDCEGANGRLGRYRISNCVVIEAVARVCRPRTAQASQQAA